MCLLCCVTLRGAAYWIVTLHMLGSFLVCLISVHLFLNPPPEYPDVNISPVILSQVPLIVASYSMIATFFACLIFRAIDSDSVSQLKWSTISFAVYQILVLCVHLVFSVRFGDLLNPTGQTVFAGSLVLNFFLTLTYIIVLFLHGRNVYRVKYRNKMSCGMKIMYRNSFPRPSNYGWGVTTYYSKEMNIPVLNLLQNHATVSRTSSTSTGPPSSSYVSIGINTELESRGEAEVVPIPLRIIETDVSNNNNDDNL